MQKKLRLWAAGLLAVGFHVSAFAAAENASPTFIRGSKEAYQDIKMTLGLVPEFMRVYPESGIAGAWMEFKGLQLNPNTALSGKDKELIGLAVAAQIPCQYCVYFHTKAAKAQGANDMEVREAVASSAVTRHWSALLAGNQIEEAVFKRDTDSALNFMKGRMDRGEQVSNDPIDLVDAAAAYRDIQSSFGSVPNFFKVLPEESLIGAWRDLREFQFNPKTALSLKVKLLIGLAVSAQTPWASGNYFSTRSSMMLAGASEREIRECIAMSAQTRHWSTILNGNQINERQFRSEVDRILNRNRHDVSMVKPSRKLLVAHR